MRLGFRGSQLSSGGSLRIVRELHDALGLSDLASAALVDKLIKIGGRDLHQARADSFQLASLRGQDVVLAASQFLGQ